MPAATRPYSTAVAPDSSLAKRCNRLFMTHSSREHFGLTATLRRRRCVVVKRWGTGKAECPRHARWLTKFLAASLLSAFGSPDRQFGGRLDLFHGEARRDILEWHGRDQSLVERVIAGDVGHHNAQHVIDVAGHAVEFHHLGQRGYDVGEAFEPVL